MSYLNPRGAGRRLPAAAALLAGLVIAAPALADTGSASVIWLASPSIVVEGNGTAYNKVDPSSQNIDGKIRVELDAEVSGRIESWEAWPSLGSGVWKAFKGTGISRSKSYNSPRPKTVNEEFFFSIPWVHYAETVMGACNGRAAKLRSQGLDNATIFSQDRDVKIEVAARVAYEMTGLDRINPVPQEVEYPQEFTVICKGVTPVAQEPTRNKPDPQRTKPKVEQAVLSIHEEGSLRGACSINLSGVVETNLPNTQVKFRYRSDDGRKSELKTVNTDQSGTVIFNHEYPLSEGGTRSGKIRMVGEHPDFTSAWKNYSVNCGSPAQGYASNDPTPPTLTLSVAATPKEKMYKGFICPAKVLADGRIIAADAIEGRAIHVAAQQGVAEPQQQVDEQNFDIVKGQHWAVGYEPEIRWSNVAVVGGNPPKQTMKFTFQVARHGKAVATVQKMLVLTCRKPQTSGVGGQAPAGGVTTGKPAQTHSQQAQSFAIQVPKGVVRGGQIRLSGAAANAKYELKFYRKDGGSYVRVQSAQLPKQMTGPNGSFPLKALSGGRDWRLEVCPAGGAQSACKATDFRLPPAGGAGGAKVAPGEKPVVPMVIVPGALN